MTYLVGSNQNSPAGPVTIQNCAFEDLSPISLEVLSAPADLLDPLSKLSFLYAPTTDKIDLWVLCDDKSYINQQVVYNLKSTSWAKGNMSV